MRGAGGFGDRPLIPAARSRNDSAGGGLPSNVTAGVGDVLGDRAGSGGAVVAGALAFDPRAVHSPRAFDAVCVGGQQQEPDQVRPIRGVGDTDPVIGGGVADAAHGAGRREEAAGGGGGAAALAEDDVPVG